MSARVTPWFDVLPSDAAVFARVLRFPGRDHPRVVVALESPFPTGYKIIHLTRPVAYHSRRGHPAWVYRAVRACLDALRTESCTAADLAAVAERAHRGRGIRVVG